MKLMIACCLRSCNLLSETECEFDASSGKKHSGKQSKYICAQPVSVPIRSLSLTLYWTDFVRLHTTGSPLQLTESLKNYLLSLHLGSLPILAP